MPENYTYHIVCCGYFASGAASSAISSLTTGICQVKGVSKGWTRTAIIASGGLSGGVSASIAGGDFWDGLCNGLISSGLNHAMHLVAEVGETMLQDFQKFEMNHQNDQKIPMKLCKYFCLEAIGKYFGMEKTMGDYKDIGEKMIFNNENTKISDICAKVGFDIDFYEKIDDGGIITGNLDGGNPIMLTLGTDGTDSHAVVMTGYRESENGPQYFISNPDNFDYNGWVDKSNLTINGYYIFTNPNNLIR